MLLEQMLKRQDSLLSSSRRETPPPASKKHHATTTTSVGCMSGIFQLITNYHNRNKRLTSCRKESKSNNSCSSPKRGNKVSMTTQTCPSSKSCDVVVARKQPTLVARLMGLEEIPGDNTCKVVKREDSDEGKRRKLLEALERCNDDLATLNKYIKAVKVVDHQWLTPECVIHQRSPSPLGIEASPPCRRSMPRKKPWQQDRIETYFFRRSLANSWDIKLEISALSSKPSPSSKAMIESVDQVCQDIAWGEKREKGRIGLMLQECLWKDLIEEIVQEMFGSWKYVLPFQACQRRLFF